MRIHSFVRSAGTRRSKTPPPPHFTSSFQPQKSTRRPLLFFCNSRSYSRQSTSTLWHQSRSIATYEQQPRPHTSSKHCLRASKGRPFSASARVMGADKIDGTAIAKGIREKINAETKKTQETNPRYKPSLTIVQVGDRSDSSTYVRMKLKAAEEANIVCNLVQYPETISEPELLQDITRFNNDPSIHGILVQLPMPSHLSEHAVTSAVLEEKDVDGFGASNIGELSKRGGHPLFTPCTPKGVMVLLQESGVDLNGKNAVVLGRSDIVGSPVGALLRNADATVTVCHSRTADLEKHIKTSRCACCRDRKTQLRQGRLAQTRCGGDRCRNQLRSR